MNKLKETISQKMGDRLLWTKIALSLLGVVLIGTSVSALIYSGLGADPCSCMNLAAANLLGLPFWLFQIIINAVVLLFPLFLDRSLIGFGTVASMFLVGIIADALRASVYRFWLPAQPILALRIVFMLAGVFLLCIGAAFYTVAGLGVSAYDSIPLILTEKLNLNFRVIRIVYDMSAVAIGWALSGSIGIASILIAFGLGPMIHSVGLWVQHRLGIPDSVPIGSAPGGTSG